MISQGTITVITEKLEELKGMIDILITEGKRLEDLDRLIQKKQDINAQREGALFKKEEDLRVARLETEKERAFITAKTKELYIDRETIAQLTAKLEETKKSIITERQGLEKIKESNKLLDKKQKTLENEMQDLQRKSAELREREINIEKEMAVDKERKQRLDIMEDELIKEKERIKKYLKI